MTGEGVRNVAVLGATGSIGESTLDVLGRHPDRYRVRALTAHGNVEGMRRLCLTHRPRWAAMADPNAAKALMQALAGEAPEVEVLAGVDALAELAADPEIDQVMAAIVGAAGLVPTLAAARAGKRVLLANKEALVMAGPVFMAAIREAGAELLPIDSEHNALFQCMPAGYVCGRVPEGVRRLLLTASGGPFRSWDAERIARATPEEACAHPNWSMGRKISVDSATLMNKGLEFIEASLLFALPPERIEIVVHPESVIHSMVDYADGSVLAQLGQPDMRTPIAQGLAWPERIDSGVEPLDLQRLAGLHFEAPDPERFPCLGLAMQAARAGGLMPAVLNAANEVAVAAFLDGRIGFTAIADIIAGTLDSVSPGPAGGLDEVLAADRRARERAMQLAVARAV